MWACTPPLPPLLRPSTPRAPRGNSRVLFSSPEGILVHPPQVWAHGCAWPASLPACPSDMGGALALRQSLPRHPGSGRPDRWCARSRQLPFPGNWPPVACSSKCGDGSPSSAPHNNPPTREPCFSVLGHHTLIATSLNSPIPRCSSHTSTPRADILVNSKKHGEMRQCHIKSPQRLHAKGSGRLPRRAQRPGRDLPPSLLD